MKTCFSVKSAFALLLAVTIVACGDGSRSRAGGVTPAPVLTLEDKLQGSWEQQGYGRFVRITGREIETFDFTAETCLRIGTESVDDFSGVILADDDSAFSIRESELAFAEHYTRLDDFPAVCTAPIANRATDIYRHIWHSFYELYAFFEQRDIDWLAQFDATRDAVVDEMSEAELFQLLVVLLLPFDDEHVLLSTGDQSFSPAQPKGFLKELITEFEAQSEVTDLNDYILAEIGRWDAIIRNEYLAGRVTTAGDETLVWGVIADNVGYLRLDAMIFNFEESIDDQVGMLENLLDEVFTDLAETHSLIVDVRLNGGGADPFALAVARRFMDAERLVLSKYTRTLEGNGPLQNLYLSPSTRPSYLKPVVLITSGFTTSAAESFTLAMRTAPQVTHLGETTNGALSDVLSKPLPNGWQVDLSNEVYVDDQGTSYEVTGIQPAMTVPVFRARERLVGQDSALNAALQYLGEIAP